MIAQSVNQTSSIQLNGGYIHFCLTECFFLFLNLTANWLVVGSGSGKTELEDRPLTIKDICLKSDFGS